MAHSFKLVAALLAVALLNIAAAEAPKDSDIVNSVLLSIFLGANNNMRPDQGLRVQFIGKTWSSNAFCIPFSSLRSGGKAVLTIPIGFGSIGDFQGLHLSLTNGGILDLGRIDIILNGKAAIVPGRRMDSSRASIFFSKSQIVNSGLWASMRDSRFCRLPGPHLGYVDLDAWLSSAMLNVPRCGNARIDMRKHQLHRNGGVKPKKISESVVQLSQEFKQSRRLRNDPKVTITLETSYKCHTFPNGQRALVPQTRCLPLRITRGGFPTFSGLTSGAKRDMEKLCQDLAANTGQGGLGNVHDAHDSFRVYVKQRFSPTNACGRVVVSGPKAAYNAIFSSGTAVCL